MASQRALARIISGSRGQSAGKGSSINDVHKEGGKRVQLNADKSRQWGGWVRSYADVCAFLVGLPTCDFYWPAYT